MIRRGAKFGNVWQHKTTKCYYRTLLKQAYKLKKLNLIKNKHIPEVYFTFCEEDRRALLAGIIDTDGTIDKKSLGEKVFKDSNALEKLNDRNSKKSVVLNETEVEWIEAWNEFVVLMRKKLGKKSLPGFPIWADEWVLDKKLRIPKGTPEWKENFLRKNSEFYTEHKTLLDKWLKKWDNLEHFPPSRRKLEWQAQDAKTLWETIMHFRPSGIRAKKPTYVPALVAITQTSIIGKQKRRITVREGARLQGLPDWYDFVDQANPITYKQLGNGVNVGAVYNVIKSQVIRDLDLLGDKSELTKSILGAPNSPDLVLNNYKVFFKDTSSKSDLIPLVKLKAIN
jgi:DNA (cytosine-5)-methyltransferase 1